MNGSGYSSGFNDGGVGGPMKVFILLVGLFLLFMLFASSTISQADLNPYASQSSGTVPVTGAAAAAPVTSDQTAVQPQVITIQDTAQIPNTGQQSAQVPVSGTCTDPYTVQSGQSLSQIAVICNTTVAALRLANPDVTNVNLIFVGEQLHVPGAGAAQVTVPVTGDSTNLSNGITQAVTPTQPAIPVTGSVALIPNGTRLQVKAINFPANTPVSIAIGPQNAGYNVVAAGITDGAGSLISVINVPAGMNASPNSPWVVVVSTSGTPNIQVMSKPFLVVDANTNQ